MTKNCVIIHLPVKLGVTQCYQFISPFKQMRNLFLIILWNIISSWSKISRWPVGTLILWLSLQIRVASFTLELGPPQFYIQTSGGSRISPRCGGRQPSVGRGGGAKIPFGAWINFGDFQSFSDALHISRKWSPESSEALGFWRTHKIDNMGINVNLIFLYYFVAYDVCHWV